MKFRFLCQKANKQTELLKFIRWYSLAAFQVYTEFKPCFYATMEIIVFMGYGDDQDDASAGESRRMMEE